MNQLAARRDASPPSSCASAVTAVTPLKIALLGYRSNPFSGGQGVYLRYVARALSELGHEVHVISGEPYPELDPNIKLIKMPGLNLFEHPRPFAALDISKNLNWTDIFEWLSFLSGGFPEPYTFGRRVTRYMRQRHMDYDIIHDNQSLCPGLLGLARRGYPVVSTIHHPITFDRDIALANTEDWKLRLLIKRWHLFLGMQINVARQLNHIVTVSENSRKDIRDSFSITEDRLRVIYNGIDCDAFRPLPEVHREPRRLITTASADQPLKGTQHLIPAVAKLKESFPDLKLTFIGAPKPGGVTEKLIRQYDLDDQIEFHSKIGHQEIIELYARASIAVVPSEYEGFGLPAGEAMACQVPVVSSDGGALPEVIGDAGVVVPSKNPEALAAAIAGLWQDDNRRHTLGLAGRTRIKKLFSWRQAALSLTDFYQEVLAS